MRHSTTEGEPDLAWGLYLVEYKIPIFIRGVEERMGWGKRQMEPEDGYPPSHPVLFLQIHHFPSILSAYIWNALTTCCWLSSLGLELTHIRSVSSSTSAAEVCVQSAKNLKSCPQPCEKASPNLRRQGALWLPFGQIFLVQRIAWNGYLRHELNRYGVSFFKFLF